MNKTKKPKLIDILSQDGKIKCYLCDGYFLYFGGHLTKHLKTSHQKTIQDLYLNIFSPEFSLCLCGCGKHASWEPRGGFYKDFINGHNFRGKTKENDLYVKIRSQKIKNNPNTKRTQFKKGQTPWNKNIDDDDYYLKLSKILKTRPNICGRYIKSGLYKSTKLDKEILYQSSWELDRFKELDLDDKVVDYKRCEDVIKYININNKIRRYIPDIEITYNNDTIEVEEIKGWLNENITLKLNAARDFYQNTNKKYKILTKYNKHFIEIDINSINKIKRLEFKNVTNK